MVQSCRHIFAGNHQCAAPALRGQFYCRHHRGIHDWDRRSGLRSQIKPRNPTPTPTQTPTQTYDHGTILVPEPRVCLPLELEFPEDRASIQINIYRVADYLARGLMDRSTATAIMYGMQVCQTNLGQRPLIETAPAPSQSRSQSRSNSSNADSEEYSETTYYDPSNPPTPVSRPVTRVILTPDGDEIAPPAEILEDNEAEPIHHKGCPCLLCAEKYRNQPPELHHHDCQCGLCEEDEGSGLGKLESERSSQGSALPTNDVMALPTNDAILSEARSACGVEGPASANLIPEPCALGPELIPDPCALVPKPRIARAAALLSGSTSRDPLNRPWSVAEYTFGDAIRRHEAQYAARAAAALAEGIEPPPYEPFTTGMIPPGHPDYEEDQQMQQHSNEYWAEHFRKQIAERPDIQQYLDEEAARDRATETGTGN
jgi:hypothetical protein